MKHLDPQGDPPSPDELRALLGRYRFHARARLGGAQQCHGCGASADRSASRWRSTGCDSGGVRVSGQFHHHIPQPHGCGGPPDCAQTEVNESIELTWREVHELLARDQLALSLT